MRHLFSLLMLCFLAPATWAAPHYAITDLGQLPVPSNRNNIAGYAQVIPKTYDLTTTAVAINNQGQVVGQSNGQAYLWQKGVMRGLGILPSTGWGDYNISRANAINNTGEIVGGSGGFIPIVMSGRIDCLAFRWTKGKMKSITAANDTNCEALGINNQGDVVGLHGYRAFFLRGITRVNLGILSTVPAGNQSEASGINERGQVVGVSTINGRRFSDGSLPNHAALWQKTGNHWHATDLGTLPGFIKSEAHAVNNKGQIVGAVSANVPGNPDGARYQAFLWSKGHMHSLTGAKDSAAYAVNDRGQIVGTVDSKAALWQDGRAYDLNMLTPLPLGVILTRANGINSRGQIVANGTLKGQARAFLLTPQHSRAQRKLN